MRTTSSGMVDIGWNQICDQTFQRALSALRLKYASVANIGIGHFYSFVLHDRSRGMHGGLPHRLDFQPSKAGGRHRVSAVDVCQSHHINESRVAGSIAIKVVLMRKISL